MAKKSKKSSAPRKPRSAKRLSTKKLKPAKGASDKPRVKAAAAKSSKAAGTDPKRVAAILERLDEAYPAATCALIHANPFQLLISTILSAQTTDERVNQVTATLYKKYPDARAIAYASPKEMEQEIRPTGFFRNKTKSILGASKKIVEEFHGEVPKTMEELLTLPGVARKTANVVLGTAFAIPSGIVVDTHVARVSERLDLTRNTDPKKIEQDLMQVIPKDKWILFSHQLIWHGRRVCQARKPKCIECNLNTICYSADKTI
ncbi:MAG TPA: endonuclease III [Candidatus Acidoferrales bacterium]|nr:endonuclease III [Candidatus Acidoferrales bacterium]